MKKYIRSSLNPRESEYYKYLSNHIRNVRNSWDMLEDRMIESGKYKDVDYFKVYDQITNHDTSKLRDDEFDAYCNYFYPATGHGKDSKAFDAAWLHHQHNNSHHWQYYCLIRDDGSVEPLDMPIEDICEMLCDWHSFSYDDPKSTAYKWYKSNKSKMKLSDKTRKQVEALIELLQDPLSSEVEE